MVEYEDYQTQIKSRF